MDQGEAAIIAAVVAGGVALVGAAITFVASTLQLRQSENKQREDAKQAATAYRLSEEAFRRQYQLEFAAERVARELLMDEKWPLRSFETIAHHLSGFGADELRKVLVRAGAIRFDSDRGMEFWGLLERNRDRLGVKLAHVPDDSRFVDTERGGREIAVPDAGPMS
jgi:hypothetical protein